MSTRKPKLIVIGAGITGLYVARKLAKDFDIVLLEAQHRPGGRILTVDGDDGPIDGGAEFVHGNGKLTKSICKEYGIKLIEVEGEFLQNRNGEWISGDEMHSEKWDQMMRLLKKADAAATLDDFLDEHYSDDKEKDFRQEIQTYAEGFDLADVSRVSARALYAEWSASDRDARPENGYAPIIDCLVKDLKDNAGLHLNMPVVKIGMSNNKVEVTTANGETFTSDHVLITLPLSLLAQEIANNSIQFPASFSPYREAAAQVGFGAVVKIVLECHQPFWNPEAAFIFSEERIPTWWSQLPSTRPVLTGWLGGPAAKQLESATDAEIEQISFESLSAIFKMSESALRSLTKKVHVFNWQANPWARGGYSYSTPAATQARQLLRQPYHGRIWFAGEGLYEGPHPGTVEAALMSAAGVIKSIRLKLRFV